MWEISILTTTLKVNLRTQSELRILSWYILPVTMYNPPTNACLNWLKTQSYSVTNNTFSSLIYISVFGKHVWYTQSVIKYVIKQLCMLHSISVVFRGTTSTTYKKQIGILSGCSTGELVAALRVPSHSVCCLTKLLSRTILNVCAFVKWGYFLTSLSVIFYRNRNEIE